MALLIGQQVMTTKGKATVVGFETFTAKGGSGPITSQDNGRRVICCLDDPKAWVPTLLTPHPYMFRTDILSVY
jgi:hypothetical protein